MGRRGRRRGHCCWCCGRHLPNERFSGRGHARHLCRSCRRLPREEHDHQQAMRGVDRILYGPRGLAKKSRRLVRYLEHPDARVRRHVAEILAPPEHHDEPEPEWEADGERGEARPREVSEADWDIPF